MKNLASVVLAFFDLAEAEGRLLQTRVLHTVRSCLWFALGVIFMGAAVGFFLAATLDWLVTLVPRPAALALTGLGSAIIAGIFIIGAYLCLRPKKETERASQPELEARN